MTSRFADNQGRYDRQYQTLTLCSVSYDNEPCDFRFCYFQLALTRTGFRFLSDGIGKYRPIMVTNEFRSRQWHKLPYASVSISIAATTVTTGQSWPWSNGALHFFGMFCTNEAIARSVKAFYKLRFADIEQLNGSNIIPRGRSIADQGAQN
jgi:hypothetical protein